MIIDASHYALEETPWTERAACRGIQNPDVFFPGQGESTAEARAICHPCPVRQECLEYALRWRIDHGVWGGKATRERQRIEKTRGRPRLLPAPHGTTTRYARGCRCETCSEARVSYSHSHDRNGT